MPITVMRQYIAYDLVDAKSYHATTDITIKITENQSFLLLPVEGYKADLKITDSVGHDMIILSDHEFEKEYGLSMNEIKKEFHKRLEQNDENIKKSTAEYSVIAVLLNNDKNLEEYYDKIKIEWMGKTNIKNGGWISKNAEIHISMPRYGFKQNASSAIDLSIRTDPKHEIFEESIITNLKSGKVKHIPIVDNINQKIYHFDKIAELQLVHVNVKMGLPNTVIEWARLGLIVGIFLPLCMVGFTIMNNRVPQFTFELMAGVIALLIGERVLVFQDISLMKSWSKMYLFLIIWCVMILVGLIFISELSFV